MEKIFLIFSLITTLTYLVFVVTKHGWLPSISHSAYYEKYAFICFILCLSWPLAIVAWSAYTWIAASILSLIGFWTGYNPCLYNNKLENKLHGIFTIIPIVIVLFDIIHKGIISKNTDMLIFSISCVIGFVVPSFILWKKQTKNHTYWIEIFCLAAVFLFYWVY